MKTIIFLNDPLADCLDIIIWTDIFNGESLASVNLIALINEFYCQN